MGYTCAIRPLASAGAGAMLILAACMALMPKEATAQERRFDNTVAQIKSLYETCSRDYADVRGEFHADLLRLARTHQDRASAALAGSRFDEMAAEYARAVTLLLLIGQLPPPRLPEPCPPLSPPPFRIAGTAIAVYDSDLAEEWGPKLEELRTNTCSNRHAPLLRRAKADVAADRAARERAARETEDTESQVRHESDARALQQLESVLPEQPCSGPRVPRVGGPGPNGPTSSGGEFEIPGTGVFIKIGAAATDGIKVQNGGLGGRHTLPLYNVSIGFDFDREAVGKFLGSWPVSRVRFGALAEWGSRDKNLGRFGTSSGNRVFRQPTGGTQTVSGGFSGTGGRTKVDFSRVAAEIELGFDAPVWGGRMEVGTTYYDRRTTHAPFVKVGYEHSRLATELAAEWDGINFEIVDGRTVRTNRFSIGGGFDSTVPLTPDVTLLWRGFLQLNADLSRARGSYFTEQTANFSTTVNGTASDFAITPGAGIQLGINRAFPNGAEGWLRGELEVGSFPRLRYRINGSPTISRAYHHSYRFSLGIRY